MRKLYLNLGSDFDGEYELIEEELKQGLSEGEFLYIQLIKPIKSEEAKTNE